MREQLEMNPSKAACCDSPRCERRAVGSDGAAAPSGVWLPARAAD